MSLASGLLILGVLCALWDSAFGVRLYQAGRQPWPKRLAFAWRERRLTLLGLLLTLASAVAAIVTDG